MATFQITTPDGATYEITRPDTPQQQPYRENPLPPARTAPQPAQPPSVMQDIAQSAPSALGRGALAIAGMPGDISELALRGYDWLTGAEQSTPEQMRERLIFPTSQEVISGYEGVTGTPFTRAQTGPGKIAEAALEAIPSAATLGGGLGVAARQGVGMLASQAGKNAMRYGAVPMGASEAAGQATEGTPLEVPARIFGALIGAAGPNLASRLVTPNPSDPARQAAVKNLDRLGVQTTAGQRTGSKPLQYMESEIGGRAAENITTAQKEQFTRAALQRAGIYGDRATPEVLRKAYSTLGDDFDSLAKANRAIVDQTFVDDLARTADEYSLIGAPEEKIKALERFAHRIGQTIDPTTGTIPGDAYKSLRSSIGRAAASGSDPDFSFVLRQFQDALDSAMERGMVAAGSPDVGAWQAVRQRYKDFLVLERAVGGPGGVEGLVSPAKLRQALETVSGRRNYVLGRNSFDDLARSGSQIMRELPQSGTASRLAVRGLGQGAGAMVGALGSGGDIGTMAGGALAGSALPALAGRAVMSRPGQAYLGNQLWRNRPGMTPQGVGVTGLNFMRDFMTPSGPMIGLPQPYQPSGIEEVSNALIGG